MRAVVIMLTLLAISCSSTVNSQDQFTGNELKFKSMLTFGLDIPPSHIEKLSPEALERIWSLFAQNVGDIPPHSFNDWFQQDSSATTELDAQVRSELRAMIAKELEASEEFLEDDEEEEEEQPDTEE